MGICKAIKQGCVLHRHGQEVDDHCGQQKHGKSEGCSKTRGIACLNLVTKLTHSFLLVFVVEFFSHRSRVCSEQNVGIGKWQQSTMMTVKNHSSTTTPTPSNMPLQSQVENSDAPPETMSAKNSDASSPDEATPASLSPAATSTTRLLATTQQQADAVENDTTARPLRPDFQMGDHVYQWCSFWGIPAVFCHHGIVLDAAPRFDTLTNQWRIRVVDFSNGQPVPSPDEHLPNDDNDDDALENVDQPHHENNDEKVKKDESSFALANDFPHDNAQPTTTTPINPPSRCSSSNSSIRVYETNPADWHKVTYEASAWRHSWARSGTSTRCKADPAGLVRARVQFLLDHGAALVPSYHAVRSNSECVAVWCKTGTWATLQATSWLSAMAAGQVKSTATLVGAAASTQVTVPSAGLWGWMGYTTQVSLLTTQPWLVPALAGYGLVTIGGPALWLVLAQRHWKKLTQTLNTAFWEAAVNQPEVFCEHLMQWSTEEEEGVRKNNTNNHAKLTTTTEKPPAHDSVHNSEQSPMDQVQEKSLLSLGPKDVHEPQAQEPLSAPSVQFACQEPVEG